MKRVLMIGTTNIYGGVGHMIFEFCRNIDRNAIQFDFLYYEDITEKELELIKAYGGNFYKIPRYSRHPVQFYKKITEFFKTHHYDVVHIHASTTMLIMYALPVWKSDDTKLIYQSHCDSVDGFANRILHAFFKGVVVKHTDVRAAVSGKAARFMYGERYAKDTVILKNGIAIQKYEFHEETRERVRTELGLSEKFVLGHVGRFTYPKNHPFVIEVFEQLHKVDDEARLLLIGKGEDEDAIRQLVEQKKLTESVIFYGVSDCVEELLCAMDCFIFPSNYEGLGIVALEAQANGLPVVASSAVPKEAKVTDIYRSLSLTEDSPEVWAETILEFRDAVPARQSRYEELSASGYDIVKVSKELEKIYMGD